MCIKFIRLTFAVFFCFSQNAFGQARVPSVEITPYYRYDHYPQFSFQIDGRARIDSLEMFGNSYGVSANYTVPVSNNYTFKFGLGYHRYSFTKIDHQSGRFDFSGREILYPNPTAYFFITDRYWYNTVSTNLSIVKNIRVSKNLEAQAGILISNFVSFSQYYHLPAFDIDYKTQKVAYFGFSGAVDISLLRPWNKLKIGPSLILPIIDFWKKDALLPEDNQNSFKTKYFNGVGIGLKMNYLLH